MTSPRPATGTAAAARALLYAVIVTAAVALPLLLWPFDSPLVGDTYGREYRPFELLGLTGSVAIVAIAGLELRRRPRRSLADVLPVVVAALVGFVFLGFVVEYSRRSWDYRCYESAARALVTGADPYDRTAYLYPPLLAQLLARAHGLAAWIQAGAGVAGDAEDGAWFVVFYLYQCLQLLAVNLVFLLLYRFARRLEVPPLPAAFLAAALVLCDDPVLRTLRHNQINFYLVDLILLAILVMGSRPFLSGLLVALGAHLKLYPALVALPMLIVRGWTALLGVAVGVSGIVLLQTGLGTDFHLWERFGALAGSFPRSRTFRDNSLHSVVSNVTRFGLQPAGVAEARVQAIASVLALAVSLAVLVWFAARFFRRESAFRRLESGPGESAARDLAFRRFSGHVVDSVALMLLLSPMVWEHHYVLALPLAVWAVATRGAEKPWPTGAALLLMFAVPTFDVFPLSYHRIAGLLMLVALTPPGAARRPAQPPAIS
jgi:hypothetical protein